MYIILTLMVLIVICTITAGIIIKYKNVVTKRGKSLLKINLAGYIPLIMATVIIMIPKVSKAAETAGAGLSEASGLGFIAAALSTGLATIGTGVAVGSVGSSALGAVSEEPGMLGKSLIFVGLAEGIAIYGLIISIMILGRI